MVKSVGVDLLVVYEIILGEMWWIYFFICDLFLYSVEKCYYLFI